MTACGTRGGFDGEVGSERFGGGSTAPWKGAGVAVIVVHTNVMVRLVVGGPGGAGASWLFLRDPEWAAPPILMSELMQVLLGLVRRSQLTADEARAMCDDAAAVLGPRVVSVPSARVIEAALESGLAARDAEFVVAARELGVRLATLNRAILRGFPDVALDTGDA